MSVLFPEPVPGVSSREGSGGADFSPDGRTVYWSSPGGGTVRVFDVATGQALGEIALDSVVGGERYHDSLAVELKTSADGRHLLLRTPTTGGWR
jgi:WD40 repeat protein